MENLSTITDDDLKPSVTAKIEHDSTIGDVFGVWIVNLMLSILTLGIYSFWGRTRMRKLLWSHTSLLGDRFEYHGRGLELFLGFLMASILFFVPLTIINSMVVTMEDPATAGVLQLLPMILAIILVPVALFTARRYLLTRTSWRGVRGDQPAGFWGFAARAIGAYFVTVFSLGLAFPWAAARVMSHLNRLSRFGGQNFDSDIKAWPLFKAFMIHLFGVLVMLGLVSGLFVFPFVEQAQNGEADAQAIGLVFLFSYLGFLLLTPLFYAWFQLIWWRQFFGTLTLKGTRAEFSGTFGNVLVYFLKIILVMIFTLGLGGAFVQRLKIRFLAQHLTFHDLQDLEELVAERVTELHAGEGLSEALFDGIGVGF